LVQRVALTGLVIPATSGEDTLACPDHRGHSVTPRHVSDSKNLLAKFPGRGGELFDQKCGIFYSPNTDLDRLHPGFSEPRVYSHLIQWSIRNYGNIQSHKLKLHPSQVSYVETTIQQYDAHQGLTATSTPPIAQPSTYPPDTAIGDAYAHLTGQCVILYEGAGCSLSLLIDTYVLIHKLVRLGRQASRAAP